MRLAAEQPNKPFVLFVISRHHVGLQSFLFLHVSDASHDALDP